MNIISIEKKPNFRNLFSYIYSSFFCLGVCLLLMESAFDLVVSRYINTNLLYIVTNIMGTFFLLTISKKNPRISSFINRYTHHLFVALLISITIYSFNTKYIPILAVIYNYSVITTIFIGIISFYYLSSVKKTAKSISPTENDSQKLKSWEKALVGLVLSISVLLMMPRIESYITVDEPRWISTNFTIEKTTPESYEEAFNPVFVNNSYSRSEIYWDNYLSGNLKGTFVTHTPGATINFLQLPAYLIKDHVEFNDYLFLTRLIIILHNLILSLIIYKLFKSISPKYNALLFLIALCLLPSFIGYSRIVNHDSIQGLYIIGFIISLWSALEKHKKSHYIYSGIFYALALFSQYTSFFIQILLFLIPIFHFYTNQKISTINIFVRNLGLFFISAIITTLIILPAIISYPEILIERLFLYTTLSPSIVPILIIILILISLTYKNNKNTLFEKIRNTDKYLIPLMTGGILISLITIYIQRQEIFSILNENSSTVKSSYFAISGSIATFLFSTPEAILLLFLIWIGINLKKREFNLSFFLILIFFTLIIGATISSFGTYDDNKTGFVALGTRYIHIFIPIFLAGLFLTQFNIGKKKFIIIALLIGTNLTISNYRYAPLFTLYNNILLPKDTLIAPTVWGTDTGEIANFLNENFSYVKVYVPRGGIKELVNNDIKIIPWYEEFWRSSPEYIAVQWEKNHKYSAILDYYRNNNTPIWKIERNGIIVSAIYSFDKNIDYKTLVKN